MTTRVNENVAEHTTAEGARKFSPECVSKQSSKRSTVSNLYTIGRSRIAVLKIMDRELKTVLRNPALF